MGSAEFSVPILVKLIEDFNVQAVITEIDKPEGRDKVLVSPPTKIIADKENIPCWQPASLKKNTEILKKIEALSPDVIIVAAYGKLLPEALLNIPEHGCLNVHPSLLPIYRGPSPIQTALLNGDKETGVSIMLLDKEMDAGDLLEQKSFKIKETDDYNTLSEKFSMVGAKALSNLLPTYLEGDVVLETQNDEKATFCYKISKQSGLIDWAKSAEEINNQLRAYKKWPGIFSKFNAKKIDVLKAAVADDNETTARVGEVYKNKKRIFVKCGNGSLELLEVKLEGKKQMSIQNFVNGNQAFVGSSLG